MPHSTRNVAVIGLGSFGSSVARELSRFGDNVLGLDLDEARVSRVSEALYRAVIVDSRDERALEEAGIGDYDTVVVAMASDLESSVLSVVNSRQCGVEKIWAKAATDTHARILESIGVDRVLQPEHEYGEHIAHMLHNVAMQDYIRLADGLQLGQIRVDRARAGQPLADLHLLDRFNLRCLGLVRDGAFHDCAESVELAEEDTLLVVGTRDDMRAFVEKI